MLDIKFLRKFDKIRNDIIKNKYDNYSVEELFKIFEKYRNKTPFIFNIETTNLCNMSCIMCPRTNLMNRKIESMNMDLFRNIIDQIHLHPQEELDKYYQFVRKTYGIKPEDRNENAFYYYISATHLTLHGFGEPVLDSKIIDRIELCSSKDIPTYFSMVPANIKINQIKSLMDSSLGVLKFALDSLDDEEQKRIRGKNNNFTEAYQKILQVIDLKEKEDYNTKIIITLIDLSNKPNTIEMQQDFIRLWKDYPVFAYVKSQDNRWLYEEDQALENKSHYEKFYCEFPWTSLSIMVDGSIVPCTQDYNTELTFGNAHNQSLYDAWNGNKLEEFRKKHISGIFKEGWKCAERCDLNKCYQRIRV